MKMTIQKGAVILLLLCLCATFAFAGEPMRIISHLPSFTEILYELGLGDQIVAVCDFVKYPPEVSKKTRIGGLMNTNFETVLSLRPTVIFVDVSMKEQIGKYKSFGLNAVEINTMTVSDALQSVIILGEQTGRVEAAKKLEKRIRTELDRVRSENASKRKLTTLIVIGHDPGELRAIYTAGTGTFHNEILRIAGGKNCFEEKLVSYPNISKEVLLEKSPQVILVLAPNADGGEKAVQTERDLWKSLSSIDAVKNDCIYLLTDDSVQQPGPRMPKAASLFAEAINDCRSK